MSGLLVIRSRSRRLTVEAFLPMLRSDKISRMELKVLFSEDPAFVGNSEVIREPSSASWAHFQVCAIPLIGVEFALAPLKPAF